VGAEKSGGRVLEWASEAERGEIWLLMVYVKAKFDKLPLSFLSQLRELIENGQ
jgi:hypothetical protein